MSLKAPKGSYSNRPSRPRVEAMEAGTYPCRLVQVLDMGVQPQRPYKGEEKAPAHELRVTFEFVDSFMPVWDEEGEKWTEEEDLEKPRWVSNSFPLRSITSDLATSTKWYTVLDPDMVHDGDWSKILGTPVNVTITKTPRKDGEGFTNYIASISTMRPRDVEKTPELKNPPKILSLSETDTEMFNSLAKWIKDLITSGLEFKGTALQKALDGEDSTPNKPVKESESGKKDDDIPW